MPDKAQAPKEDQLTVIAKESGLEQSKVENLLSNFAEAFQEAKKISENTKDIVVTSEDQTEEMLLARQSRLKLKNIRVDVEKTRKKLKEQSLREGKAIDGMANIIKALIVPIEEHLEEQEKFAEIQEAKRRSERHTQRVEELSKYVEDVSVYSLVDMSDEAYATLLNGAKAELQKKKEAEEAEQKERLEREKAEREEQERIRKENEDLKQAAERKAKAEAKFNDRINQISALGLLWDGEQYSKDDFNISVIEIKTLENDKFNNLLDDVAEEMKRRKELAAKEAEEKEKADQQRVSERSKQLKEIGMPVGEVVFGFRISGLDLKMSTDKEWQNLLEQAEKRIKLDKESKEKAQAEEAERKKKFEQERQAREEAEAKIKKAEEEEAAKVEADAEAKRELLLGPDKDKLIKLADDIDALEYPLIKDESAKKLMLETKDYLDRVNKNLRKKAEEL